tara:strand:+ start:275 stop:448 length:174 start_codon:yes stop_codon:yes gene_type:complete
LFGREERRGEEGGGVDESVRVVSRFTEMRVGTVFLPAGEKFSALTGLLASTSWCGVV